jgi:hypothetical protein
MVTKRLFNQSHALCFLSKCPETLDLPVLLRIVWLAVHITNRTTSQKGFKYRFRELPAVVTLDAERSIGYAVQNQL